MPYFAIKPSPNHPPTFEENSTPFLTHLQDDTSSLSSTHSVPAFKSPSSRRLYFANESNRRAIPYHASDIITTDFCYGFLSFPEIRLNIPGGISFDLMRYWDGQPVRFVCCERKRREGRNHGGDSSASSVDSVEEEKRRGERKAKAKLKGPGEPFWVVVFEAVLDGHEEEREAEVSGSSSAVTPDEEMPPHVPHAQVAHGAAQPTERLEDQTHLRDDID
jgi:hypothetical protein